MVHACSFSYRYLYFGKSAKVKPYASFSHFHSFDNEKSQACAVLTDAMLLLSKSSFYN